jgi:hypothetical protein
MPTPSDPEDGWIRVDQFNRQQPQKLNEDEIDDYLNWQFRDLAKKPKPMTLKETASVVRFLRWLSHQGVPREILRRGAGAV